MLLRVKILLNIKVSQSIERRDCEDYNSVEVSTARRLFLLDMLGLGTSIVGERDLESYAFTRCNLQDQVVFAMTKHCSAIIWLVFAQSCRTRLNYAVSVKTVYQLLISSLIIIYFIQALVSLFYSIYKLILLYQSFVYQLSNYIYILLIVLYISFKI